MNELRLALPHPLDRAPAASFAPIRVQRLFATLRAHWRVIAGSLAAFLAVATLYVLLTPKTYSATATVTLEQRQREVVEGGQVLSDLPVSLSGVADTQVEVLRSGAVAAGAVERLGLQRARELLDEDDPRRAGSDAEVRAAAAEAISRSIVVVRLGVSFAISVTARAGSPVTASDIANAVVESYLAAQRREKNSATEEAASYLRSQIDQLRGEVRHAEQAVSSYEAANGLLASTGSDLTEQRMSEFQRQEAEAQAAHSEKAARLGVAERQLGDANLGDGSIGEGQNSEVIRDLRAKLADVVQRQSEAEVRYGARHPIIRQLQNERGSLEAALRVESRRIIEGLEADATAARGRLASVSGSVAQARSTLARENTAAVPLAELTREAEAKRSLYKTYLARYQQLMAVRGQASPDARLASPASPASTPDAPRPVLAYTLAIAFGLALGLLLAMIAEILEHRVRSREDIEDTLRATYLGFTPLIDPAGRRDGAAGLIDKQPTSQFSEAFRSLRLMLDPHGSSHQGSRKNQVVAVTSAMPDEGKTTTALALARSTVRSGRTVLLIDCDSRRQGLTAAMVDAPPFGLAEVIEGTVAWADAIHHDPSSGCDFLAPCGPGRLLDDDLENDAVAAVISAHRRHYDLIILDCGPLLAVAEAQARVTLADQVLLLARWRRTPLASIKAALALLHMQKVANVGVIITMIPPGATEAGSIGYYDRRLPRAQAA